MQSKDKVFDDIARMAGGTVSILSGLGQQVREDIKARIEEMADQLDLVPRADFDRLESMLVKSRKEQDALIKRIEALEKKQSPAKAKAPAKKAAPKAAKKKTKK